MKRKGSIAVLMATGCFPVAELELPRLGATTIVVDPAGEAYVVDTSTATSLLGGDSEDLRVFTYEYTLEELGFQPGAVRSGSRRLPTALLSARIEEGQLIESPESSFFAEPLPWPQCWTAGGCAAEVEPGVLVCNLDCVADPPAPDPVALPALPSFCRARCENASQACLPDGDRCEPLDCGDWDELPPEAVHVMDGAPIPDGARVLALHPGTHSVTSTAVEEIIGRCARDVHVSVGDLPSLRRLRRITVSNTFQMRDDMEADEVIFAGFLSGTGTTTRSLLMSGGLGAWSA